MFDKMVFDPSLIFLLCKKVPRGGEISKWLLPLRFSVKSIFGDFKRLNIAILSIPHVQNCEFWKNLQLLRE